MPFLHRPRAALAPGLLVLALSASCLPVDGPSDEEIDHAPDVAAPAETFTPELAFPGRTGTTATSEVRTAAGRRVLTYEIFGDMAVYEGDILLGHPDHLNRPDVADSVGRANTGWRWPGGVVPFVKDANLTPAQSTMVDGGIAIWNDNTIYRLVPRTTQADFVRFVPNAACSSWVGKQGGSQDINVGGCGLPGNVAHEIGHAVGLWHEQSRADRDSHVIIQFANITPGMEFNFQTYVQQGQDGEDLFDYDFGSIMHYSSFAFSRNGQPTITRRDGTTFTTQRNNLSFGDIAGATRLLVRGTAHMAIVGANVGSHGAQCLDIPNGSRAPNAPLQTSTCHGNGNQRFAQFLVAANRYLLINQNSGLCLDVPDASLDNGVRLQQFPCHGRDNQRFEKVVRASGPPEVVAWRNQRSQKCLDVADARTDPGAPVNQIQCHFNGNQRWFATTPSLTAPRLFVEYAGCRNGAPRFVVDWENSGGLPPTTWDVDVRRGVAAWASLYDGPNQSLVYSGANLRNDAIRVRGCNFVGCSVFTTKAASADCETEPL